MDPPLSDVQVRVLGALIEKSRTTPDYYPMTLNALVNACNQKNNRDPVTELDPRTVELALAALRERSLIFRVHSNDSRVVRFKQSLAAELELDPAEEALLCELMLRGPQTAGELRGRCSRMHPFDTLEEVERVLGELMQRLSPLVVRLARPAGRKAAPYGHLLTGDVPPAASFEPAPARAAPREDRLVRLEQQVAELRAAIERIEQRIDEIEGR